MLRIVQGDITRFSGDAIITPNNTDLQGRNPVCRSILKKAGAGLLRDCVRLANETGGCPAGEAVITDAGRLLARKIIHAVPPVWQGGNANEKEQLNQCYSNIFHLAEKHKCTSIAIPSLGTKFFKYPKKRAAQVAIEAVKKWLKTHDIPRNVVFVLENARCCRLYKSIMSSVE